MMNTDYDKLDELLDYMKSRGIDKETALGVVLICKTDNQMTAILQWLQKNENIDDIFVKCLEIEKTIKE